MGKEIKSLDDLFEAYENMDANVKDATGAWVLMFDALNLLRVNEGIEVMVKSWIEGGELVFKYSAHKLGETSSYFNHEKTYIGALSEGLKQGYKLIDNDNA